MHPEFLFGVLLPRKWPRLTLSPVKHEHPVEDQAQSPMEEDLITKASGMVTNAILVVTFSQAAVSFGYKQYRACRLVTRLCPILSKFDLLVLKKKEEKRIKLRWMSAHTWARVIRNPKQHRAPPPISSSSTLRCLK